MKIETPQILWHNGSDNESNKNAPLYSVSMLESGFCQDSLTNYGHVLATSGNSSDINLWKLSFRNDSTDKRIIQNQPLTKIEHMLSLTRHERSVNAIAFSPDGLHLATAGDGGSVLIWSVPPSKRGNQNGRHFWSTLEKEGDLSFRIVTTSCEGISDISWSPDSKRFMVGSIDHSVQIYEDESFDYNTSNANKPQIESQWKHVYRNASDHSHFVQGVAFDPLGVYVASMGSDRTVRVYARKAPNKFKKKVLRPKDANDGPIPPPDHAAMVEQLLISSKLDLGKAKTIKSRELSSGEDGAPPKRTPLFADESTVESFFRRLSWTTDGAFLITPCALWHQNDDAENDKENSSPSFATLLFARHRYDAPYKVLPGLEKPSVAVRPSPILYKLPETVPMETDENKGTDASTSASTSPDGLPYRSVFAVLTQDSVLIYDTLHDRPLCIARGLHYAGLTDCTWSVDGRQLIVSSSDGYLSILSFDEGEFGDVYTPPPKVEAPKLEQSESDTTASVAKPAPAAAAPRIPPCEPGQTASIEGRPAKRAKTRITPTLISATAGLEETTTAATVPSASDEGVKKKASEDVEQPKPKKKRIQPTLVSANP